MGLKWGDKIRETTAVVGTGAATLLGAAAQCFAFSSFLSDGDTTDYFIRAQSGSEEEWGVGTYSSSGNSITRTTVMGGSNGTSAVSFGAGTKDIYCFFPAWRATTVFAPQAANIVLAGPSSGGSAVPAYRALAATDIPALSYDVLGAAAAAQAASQPLDSDLTAIAALATTSFGRGGLTQVDAAGFRSYIGAGTGGGDALTANPLSQFATTTSAQLAGVVSDETGTGKLVFATSPTLVTPVLGAATATSVNGLTFTVGTGTLTLSTFTLTVAGTASVSGTNTGDQSLPVGANPTATIGTTAVNGSAATFMRSDAAPAFGNLTSDVTSVGLVTTVAKVQGTAVSGTTGSGNVVFSASPTLTTPTLGVATATSLNGLTVTATTGTLTLANGKTLTVDKSLEFDGTDSTKMTFPATSATLARTDAAQTFSGNQTFGATVYVDTASGTAAGYYVKDAGAIQWGWYRPAGSDDARLTMVNVADALTIKAGNGYFGIGAAANNPGSPLTVIPPARTSGVAPYVQIVTPADNPLTASTASPGICFGGSNANPPATVTRTWATGAFAGTQSENLFTAPTYNTVGASSWAGATLATVTITGAPAVGGNISGSPAAYALNVQAGSSLFTAGLVANNLSVGVSADTISSPNNLNLNATATLRLGTNGFIIVTTGGDVLQINAHTATTTPLLFVAAASQSVPLGIYRGGSSRTGTILNLQTSAAASLGNVGGTVFNDFADGATTHTDGTEDTLFTHTTVANTLNTNGDRIAGKVTFQTVAHVSATRRIQLYFAGTVIWDSTAQATVAADTVELTYEILRDSSTSVRCTVTPVQSGTIAFAGVTYTKIGTLTLTGTNIIKLTGIAASGGAAASDIMAVMQSIDRGEFGS